MQTTAPRDLVYACFTHVPLWVDFPGYVTPIYLGQAQGPGRLNLRDLAPDWEPHHPVLGGSAGTFALRNFILRQHAGCNQVGICQYRKFISRSRIGTTAPNYQTMDVISRRALARLPLQELMAPGGGGLLIGRPARFGQDSGAGYLQQYAGAHHVEDFLRFTDAAVEAGVLQQSAVQAFFSETLFFPGGVELGFFPADFWLATVAALEKVVRICVERFPVVRQGEQARAWAFCMERLGSWLLLEYLRDDANKALDWNQIGGHLNLITADENTREYVPGS